MMASSSTVFGALAAGFTVLAAVFGLLAWSKSYFEGKDKDAALDVFKREAVAKQTQFETQLEAQREKTELARGETERARQSAAEANERAEIARKETAEIYRKLGPRHIKPEEKKAFADATASMPKAGLVFLIATDDWTNRFDVMFVAAIERMLTEAGFNAKHALATEWNPGPPVVMPNGTIFKEPQMPGVRFELRTAVEKNMDWVEPLRAAFRAAGIQVRGPLSSRHPKLLPENGGIIVVGPKPEETFELPRQF